MGSHGSTTVTQCILSRRSAREQFTGDPIPEDTLREIALCGVAAPSSKNAQPWRLHIVTNRSLLALIADAATESPEADRWVPRNPATGLPRDDWPSTVALSAGVLKAASAAIFVENRSPFSDGRGTLAAATGQHLAASLLSYTFEVIGIGACIQNMVLASQSLGVQGAFMGDPLIAEDFIRNRLGIEGDLVGVLALGFSSEHLEPRDHSASWDDERIVVRHA